LDIDAVGTDDRRARLLEAGGVLSAWLHRQQAGWEDVPVAAARAPAAHPRTRFSLETSGEPAVPRVRAEWRVPELIAKVGAVVTSLGASLGALRDPLTRYARPVALAAVMFVVVGGGGWLARSYWLQWEAATPKAAPPAPKPVAPVVAAPQPKGRGGRGARRTGGLQVESDPMGARVSIDGHPKGTTPLTVPSLPVGSHAVLIESSSGSVRRNAVVEADRYTTIRESIFSGWLHVSAPFEVQYSEGGRGIVFDEHNQALLSPGPHDIRVDNRELAYHSVLHVEVEPGKVASISVVPAPSTLSVTASLPAEVLVDGQKVGDTPLTNFPVNLGTRDIVVKSASGVTRRFTTTVTSAPVRLDVDFSKQ
jgi:hypothetical protein